MLMLVVMALESTGWWLDAAGLIGFAGSGDGSVELGERW